MQAITHRRKGQHAVVLLITVVLASGTALAQQGQGGRGGWGAGSPYNRMYNPATVETIEGEVVAIDRVAPMRGMSYGLHLQVQTADGVMPVHLGPAWYLENQDAQIEQGDRIVVTGSRVEVEGVPAVIAAEVRRGDEVLQLRDENGVPRWSGWRGRRP